MTRRLVPFAHVGPTVFCKRRGTYHGAAIDPLRPFAGATRIGGLLVVR